MLDSFLLALREGMEAALVVGIILVQLTETKRKDLKKFVYLGLGLAAAVCLIGGYFIFLALKGAEYSSNDLLEGIILLLSSAFIAYLPFWLHRHSDAKTIQNKVSQNAGAISLFLLSFFSVFREGSELVVFIMAKVKDNALDVAIGAAGGIILSALIVILIFKLSIRLNFSLIFTLLSLVLIYIGGDMFGLGLSKTFGVNSVVQLISTWLFILGSLLLLFRKSLLQRLNRA